MEMFRMKIFAALLLLFAIRSSRVQGVPANYYAWGPAHATYYGGADAQGTNGGSCGYQNAMALGFGLMTAAISDMIYDNGLTCGACFEVKCNEDPHCYSSSVVVIATNQSPQWSTAYPGPHFDLSQPAFSAIGQLIAGHFNLQYRRVSCQKRGGVLFWVTGQTYWTSVLVYNVGGAGDVQAMSVKGQNSDWVALQRVWGQNWCTEVILAGQALAFSVTTSDGNTLVSWNVADSNWKYGQTFQGGQF